jgi:diacyltrehalose acyltransferase
MRLLCSAALVVAVVAAVGIDPIHAEASAVTVLTLQPLDLNLINPMPQELQGALCASNTCTNVSYPATLFSQAQGVTALNTALQKTQGQVIVFAYSEGAQVASDWIAQYSNTPNAPSPSNVSFVLIGNPQRAGTGWVACTGQAGGPLYPNIPANNPYHITDIARQYDGWADWPNNRSSSGYMTAAQNAEVGMATIHDNYFDVNMNSPSNIRWTQGNITYVLVPTQALPMLNPIQAIGATGTATVQNAQLKALVDSAYSYPVPVP